MMTNYYDPDAFQDAWLRGVEIAGWRWFGDEGKPPGPDRSKYDLTKWAMCPRYDDIKAALGWLSSGEAAFLVAMYSFFNARCAQEMWASISVEPFAGLASCLDERRRRILADLLISYEGW